MPWPTLTLRDRRRQTRDHIAAHIPGADATVPNSRLRAMAEAQAALTYDNDLHLDWLARMMMPDTAEGEFAERWGNIWLPAGRKAASYARGQITVSGDIGAAIASGTVLTASVRDVDGAASIIELEVSIGVTLAATTAAVAVSAITAGALGNLDEGAQVQFLEALDGVDGVAVVASPGLAGGADQESDSDLIARYIDRIQQPPHGGNAHDYVQWMLEVPGVTRAWARREMGVGSITCRFMMDDVRASNGGFPLDEDIALVTAYLDALRPVTVAEMYVYGAINQPVNITIALLVRDTPETRGNVRTELAAMFQARSTPGGTIYASWIREAISAATGEDHHDITISNQVATGAGYLLTLGTITYA